MKKVSTVTLPNGKSSIVRDINQNIWGSIVDEGSGRTFARTFEGVDNPNWKQLIALHKDATTPMTATDVVVYGVKPTHYSIRYYYGPWEQYFQEVVDYGHTNVLPTNLDHIDTSAVDSAARTKFYNKMASAFEAGTFIGELNQSLRMIRSPALALRRSVDVFNKRAVKLRNAAIAAERRKRDQRMRRLKSSTLLANREKLYAHHTAIAERNALKTYRRTMSGLLLEVQMGWQPLFNDIESAFERLKELLEEPGIERFLASARSRYTIPQVYMQTAGHFMWAADTYKTEYVDVQVRYKGAIYSEKHSDLDLTAKLSLRPGDLVTTGWNLLPWSFLVDYFVNIGDILNAMVLMNRIKYVYCVKTERIKVRAVSREVSRFLSGGNPWQLTTYDNTPGIAVVHLKKVTRTPMANVPIPELTFQLGQSLRHSLNIGALIDQRDADSGFKKRLRM